MSYFTTRKIRILSLMMLEKFEDISYDDLDKKTDAEIGVLFAEHCGSRTTAKSQLAAITKRAGEAFKKQMEIINMAKVNLKFKYKYKVAETQPEKNLVEGSVREKVFSVVERLGVANKLDINTEYGEKCGNIVDTLHKNGYLEQLPLSDEDKAEIAEAEQAEAAGQAEAEAEQKPSKGRKTKRPANEAEAEQDAAA